MDLDPFWIYIYMDRYGSLGMDTSRIFFPIWVCINSGNIRIIMDPLIWICRTFFWIWIWIFWILSNFGYIWILDRLLVWIFLKS